MVIPFFDILCFGLNSVCFIKHHFILIKKSSKGHARILKFTGKTLRLITSIRLLITFIKTEISGLS